MHLQDDHKWLTPREMEVELICKSRTVYSHIGKHPEWKKETGYQGKVKYCVPIAFIEECQRNAQERNAGAMHQQKQGNLLAIAPQMSSNADTQQNNAPAMQDQSNAFSVELLEIMRQFSESNSNNQEFLRKQNELVDKILDAERRAMDEERKRILAEAEIDKALSKTNEALAKKDALLAEKDSQLVTLTRERESYNTSLIKAKDDKKENEALRQDNTQLRGDVESLRKETDALKAELEKAKTPWWKKLNV